MFRTEDLREDVREPFVGMVVKAEYPCNCPICERGTQKLIEMGRELRTTSRIHIVIKPLEKYENFQHAWFNESKLIWSGLGAFTVALNAKLAFVPEGKTPEEQWKSVKKFLEGNIFLWESVNPVEFVSETLDKPVPKNLPTNLKDAREVWVPIKIVRPEEIGIEQSTKELRKKFLKEWEEYLEGGVEEVEEEEGVDISDILGL